MAQVKFEPVSGGKRVRVRVERGNEVYDNRDGILYEEREISVDEAREALVDAIRRGKQLARAEALTEDGDDGNG